MLNTPEDIEQSSELLSNWLETQPRTDTLMDGEDNDSLDHNIPCGVDSIWSAIWAEKLCGIFTERTSISHKVVSSNTE